MGESKTNPVTFNAEKHRKPRNWQHHKTEPKPTTGQRGRNEDTENA